MTTKTKAAVRGNGQAAIRTVQERRKDHITTPRAAPRLQAARAAAKGALVHGALVGALDAARVRVAIRLLDLGTA